jgi:hypothetical protein
MLRNPRRLLAAAVVPAAAAAVLALAVPAGASTGTAQISPEQAGYTATGAQFKTITAAVYLRDPGQYTGEVVGGFGHSVQLWSPDLVATVGVTAPRGFGFYSTYAIIYDRSTHQVIVLNPNAVECNADDNCAPGWNSYDGGSTLTLRISYSPADGHLTMTANVDEGSTFTSSYTATGQSFTQARVGTDFSSSWDGTNFSSSPWDGSYSYTPPANYVKVAAYNNVSLTTYSGHTSTLWSWWVHHKLLANTEKQTSSDWVAVPTDLFNGGASFQTWFVPKSAQSSSQPTAP